MSRIPTRVWFNVTRWVRMEVGDVEKDRILYSNCIPLFYRNLNSNHLLATSFIHIMHLTLSDFDMSEKVTSQAMNREHNSFNPSIQKSNPGFGHSPPVSAIRTAVYKKCREQWLRKIEDQEKKLAHFEAGYRRFNGTPDAARQRWTRPKEYIRELRKNDTWIWTVSKVQMRMI